ncbi:MAG: pyridoxal-phosphate dependent enzyme, partial [Mesorhizobium sp.]
AGRATDELTARLDELRKGVEAAERFLAARDSQAETPLHALPALAGELGIGALHIKDEGKRLGLGSFKALGGAYAVMHL